MNNRDEQISALLDDALETQEIQAFMQDLKRNPLDDADKLQRYQLASAALRDELDQSSFMDVSAAVHRAIAQEEQSSTRLETAHVPRRFDLSAWLRPLSGMAIAASVAMVTVVAFRTIQTESVENPVQAVADARTQDSLQPVLNQPMTVAVNPNLNPRLRTVSTADTPENATLREQQLSQYMIEHLEYAGQTTMQGMMPYVRVVSFDSRSEQ